MIAHHPALDFDQWARVFPLETFTRKEGPRKYNNSSPDDPVDRWKSRGTVLSSPSHLCEVELTRKLYAKESLGRAVPVDTFLWSTAPVEKPYLTKLGGVPHREASIPWPTGAKGEPYTFVAQFCFADSKDIVTDSLPGEVMLIFFKAHNSYFEQFEAPGDVHIEWSALKLKSPLAAADSPAPSFVVPQLSGVIHRSQEYPDAMDFFSQQGHDQPYLLSSSQSTKIGRETFFNQGDPREDGDELLCALSSFQPAERWPYVNIESKELNKKSKHYGWAEDEMMLADVGCIFFWIDATGKVTWSFAF